MNEAGQMIKTWWVELSQKFPTIVTDEYVVMPNHFHGIVVIVGAALRGCPRGGHPHRGAPTLGDVIDWFKTITTNGYIQGVKQRSWVPFPGRLWQRNYYEHVIRNEQDLHDIREYIVNNPLRWMEDENNPANSGIRTGVKDKKRENSTKEARK